MRVLIFSPHLDDEVLSCASFLDGEDDVTIFYGNMQHCFCDDGIVQKENEELIKFLGCQAIYSQYGKNINKLDIVPIADLIHEYELFINKIRPAIVVLPYPSYNQDHRIMHDAILTALRPHDINFFVKKVLLWEEPETFGTLRKNEKFVPNYFRAVDIERKIKLNSFYKTQLRKHRSFDDLRAIAHVRGMQGGCESAEAFEVLRWVE